MEGFKSCEKDPFGEEQNETSRISGAFGAFIGAIIGTVPTIVLGLFGLFSAWLGFLTAFASMKGYQLLKGARNSKYAFCVITTFSMLSSMASSVFLFWLYMDTLSEQPYVFSFFSLPVIFTFLGVQFFRRAIVSYSCPQISQNLLQAAAKINASEEAKGAQTYFPENAWISSFKKSFTLSIFSGFIIIIALIALSIFDYSFGNETNGTSKIVASLCAIVGEAAVLMVSMSSKAVISSISNCFVKTENGDLWRVDVNKLNLIESYHFTSKGVFSGINASTLTNDERQLLRASMFRAISDIKSGMIHPKSALSAAVTKIDSPILEKETKHTWKISFLSEDGQRKNISVAKAYPGFTPFPNIEIPHGPMPFRFDMVAFSLVLVSAFALGGGALGHFIFKTPPKNSETLKVTSTSKTYTKYEQNGVSYKVDSYMTEIDDGVYTGSSPNAIYSVYVSHASSESDAISALTEPLGEYRFLDDFDGFRFEHIKNVTENSENDDDFLVTMTSENGKSFKHNMISMLFKSGHTVTIGVALFENGTLVSVFSAYENPNDENDVKLNISDILKSIDMIENYETAAISAK
ncbi:MAG: hypothetical protein HFE62_00475 [Firmicutes bacterium]|nr:hypothetical protein [Bacillota bacterium]